MVLERDFVGFHFQITFMPCAVAFLPSWGYLLFMMQPFGIGILGECLTRSSDIVMVTA